VKGATFKFEGGRELEAALRELGDKGRMRRAATAALKQAIEPVATLAAELAPKDDGYLSQSIRIGNPAGGIKQGGDIVEVFVGVDTSVAAGDTTPARLAVYANVREIGAPERNDPATPYLRPAADVELPKSVERLKPLLAAEIEKSAARLARKRARAGG
jgi:hypothetical protein